MLLKTVRKRPVWDQFQHHFVGKHEADQGRHTKREEAVAQDTGDLEEGPTGQWHHIRPKSNRLLDSVSLAGFWARVVEAGV